MEFHQKVDFREALVAQLHELWNGADPDVKEIQVSVEYKDGTEIVAVRRFNGEGEVEGTLESTTDILQSLREGRV